MVGDREFYSLCKCNGCKCRYVFFSVAKSIKLDSFPDWGILTGIMGREGMLDKASELFEDMPLNDVEWNVYSFTALINAYGRNGQHEASLHLLTRMKREKVTPNLITYNTVINACAKGGLEWEGLLGLFAQMRHEGIQPDIVTYNTLLSACSRLVSFNVPCPEFNA